MDNQKLQDFVLKLGVLFNEELSSEDWQLTKITRIVNKGPERVVFFLIKKKIDKEK